MTGDEWITIEGLELDVELGKYYYGVYDIKDGKPKLVELVELKEEE